MQGLTCKASETEADVGTSHFVAASLCFISLTPLIWVEGSILWDRLGPPSSPEHVSFLNRTRAPPFSFVFFVFFRDDKFQSGSWWSPRWCAIDVKMERRWLARSGFLGGAWGKRLCAIRRNTYYCAQVVLTLSKAIRPPAPATSKEKQHLCGPPASLASFGCRNSSRNGR